WEIKFNIGGKKLTRAMKKFGQAPVPPYIKRPANLKEYQTIYARWPGSAAAPTAGLHFTQLLINGLKRKGIELLFITLHVGLGTFQPIRTGNIQKHKMHPEWASVSAETAQKINRAKKEGRRIIAVGTTTVRTLENFADKRGVLKPGKKEIDLFILPGYKFKAVDGLITNFHLPKTTLLLLVSAFLGHKEKNQKEGRQILFRAYREAIKKKYRFYSFGDAMLII
ncbi:MAG: tRNA preQ1(34) S-adenosylmethionine ribosyltransferase-isomerase QueA, partial [bacterium]|nr:tRNA preQ1(34) S-adenosylmethionine ribosyltransferase-isomerase QueA [bacterium]